MRSEWGNPSAQGSIVCVATLGCSFSTCCAIIGRGGRLVREVDCVHNFGVVQHTHTRIILGSVLKIMVNTGILDRLLHEINLTSGDLLRNLYSLILRVDVEVVQPRHRNCRPGRVPRQMQHLLAEIDVVHIDVNLVFSSRVLSAPRLRRPAAGCGAPTRRLL